MSDYPRAAIPLKPVLSAGALWQRRKSDVPSLLDAGSSLLVTSGRCAIALALRHMGIQPGDEVLLPALHCTSMVEPVVWLQAKPVFYRIHAGTGVDLEDVRRRLTSRTRVFLITHFFGFPQESRRLRDFCDEHRLVLMEDCAHAFFGEFAGRPVGAYGDYAIASAMKFFPIYDGGVLASAHHSLGTMRLDAGGLAFELKAALNALEYAVEYRRLGVVRFALMPFLAAKTALWNGFRRADGTRQTLQPLGPTASDGDYAFDPAWVSTRMSLTSRMALRSMSTDRVVEHRRANYRKLLASLSGCPGAAPLFPDLPDGVVPYVFPLLVDRPLDVFPRLKRQGVPILRFGEYRWPQMDPEICGVSADLSRRLLQFPCHQELLPEEIDWVVERVRDALTPPTGRRN
jgi:perosamine synthetase